MKKISVLGSTGSIGTQTLDVVDITKEYQVETLSAHSNVALMESQIRKYAPKKVSMTDERAAKDLKVRVADTGTLVLSGIDGVCECAADNDADTVVTAIVGIAGLKPTLSAISKGKRIALANKETLVTAGEIVKKSAKEYNAEIIPVDSEHSAIFQSISNQEKFLKKIIITASGGPFFGKDRIFLTAVTPEMALKHPNWNMGAKITVDSATLVNKGLEIIEATHLFDIGVDYIQPVVHRESIIHSLVEFCDGSVIAQLGVPDMKLPISYALSYPERSVPVTKPLDLVEISNLSFYNIDNEAFPAVELAKKAAKDGGVMCAVYNGANEAAVEKFLKGECKFTQITELIEKAMQKAPRIENATLEDIADADSFAREIVKECC
ncbi:MAG: 1-deoxy-D-xylulose-5-phosphate reductoisomerase [Clostridia bacterium]|nr:1-deoxy-D-xylulose-5-phosphate reductoisomerase [Clostridia bacterium]